MYSILIVEDEHLVRQGIRSLVDYEQFHITEIDEAEDGMEAWKKVQKKVPDIVLTDINMPHLDGVKLSALIKELSPETHIVFLTGYDEFSYALSAIKLGADDYLMKPFSKKDVEAILGKVTAKLAAERKREQLAKLTAIEGKTSSVKQLIDEKLSDPQLSLTMLAQELGFSPNYLSLLLKQELQESFQQYVINERMRKAKMLLLTTDMKVYEIAEAVGFTDMNYFSQRFKQLEKMTPMQYRKGGNK